MRELAQAMVTLAAAIPTADWQTVATTAERVRASYVLDRDMDAAQRAELARLPVEFRLQDEDFHDRARKLARDASTHDAEGATIQYARLLEACTRCHASFAQSRFPGFAPQD
jgi:cytochrome c556